MRRRHSINRRDFLKQASVAAGAGAFGIESSPAAGAAGGIALVIDPADPVAASAPVHWAIDEFRGALATRHVPVTLRVSLDRAGQESSRILVAGVTSPNAQAALQRANVVVPARAETLALVPSRDGKDQLLLATGSDVRGLVYAVTELADRARHAADPIAALQLAHA